MHPEIVIGRLHIPSFGVLLAVGFAAVLVGLAVRARATELPFPILHRATLVAFVAGSIGARLAWVLLVDREIRLATLLDYSRGTMVYGFLVGAGIAASAVARAIGVSAARLLDACTPSWVLMQIAGRIGCYLAGCCYGRRPAGAVATALSACGLDRHPTQLYEAAALVIVVIVLTVVARCRPRHGSVALAYVLLYGVIRFPVEFLRDDPRGTLLDGVFSTSQAIALFSLVLVACAALARTARHRIPYPPIARSQWFIHTKRWSS